MSEQQTPTEELVTFEFQHTDRAGNPIIDPRTGKQGFTNFTGKSEKDILEKMKTSYLDLTNAHARALSHKPVPKPEQVAPKELTAEEERQAAADLSDPTKARAAVRKLTGVDDIEARQKAADEAKFQADAKAAAYQFMSRHLNDYYPCQANSAVLSKYINDNDLDTRKIENYEVAFNDSQGQLAARPAPPAATPPPKIEDDPPPLPKRVSGGLQPGDLSGERPKPRRANAITKESINEMRKTAEGRAEYKKRMRDPEFIRQVNAAFQT